VFRGYRFEFVSTSLQLPIFTPGAGLAPATLWLTGWRRHTILSILRASNSDVILLLPRAREPNCSLIVHDQRAVRLAERSGSAFRPLSSDSSANSRCTTSATRACSLGDKLPSSRLMMLDATASICVRVAVRGRPVPSQYGHWELGVGGWEFSLRGNAL
jgi:hypothetical protein